MRAIALLLDACERVEPMLRSRELAELWAAPSALEEWTNGGLAGHLARSAFNLERAIVRREQTIDHREESSGGDPMGVVVYYQAPELADSAIGRRIRELGDEEAAGGQTALADRFNASIAALRRLALPLPPAATVEMFGRVLPIDECATACLLELVVHSDDLAVSLAVPTPVQDEAVMDLVTSTLCRIARDRHGDLALLRALSRQERAPKGGVSAFSHQGR